MPLPPLRALPVARVKTSTLELAGAALQARFRKRMPVFLPFVCTFAPTRRKFPAPSLNLTIFNFLSEVYGRISEAAVAEDHAPTSPSMRIHHMNVGVVAWSNFETGINVNGRINQLDTLRDKF